MHRLPLLSAQAVGFLQQLAQEILPVLLDEFAVFPIEAGDELPALPALAEAFHMQAGTGTAHAIIDEQLFAAFQAARRHEIPESVIADIVFAAMIEAPRSREIIQVIRPEESLFIRQAELKDLRLRHLIDLLEFRPGDECLADLRCLGKDGILPDIARREDSDFARNHLRRLHLYHERLHVALRYLLSFHFCLC